MTLLTPECKNEISTMMSPTDCNPPPSCVTEFNNACLTNSPACYSPVPYNDLLHKSGGWAPGTTSAPGFPSFCAYEASKTPLLKGSGWTTCVKYGDGYHISKGDTDKCYSNNETEHEQTLCLNESPCPLYYNTEAQKKCMRLSDLESCKNILIMANGPSVKIENIDAKKESLSSGNYSIWIFIVFITICINLFFIYRNTFSKLKTNVDKVINR